MAAPDEAGPPDSGAPDSPFVPAAHPAYPRVLNLGGPVLTSPRIVPVTFDADPLRAQIESLVTAIGTSNYWHEVTAPYGVGPAKSGRAVHLSATAPAAIDDTAVQTWLASMLDGTHPEWDLPDGNTMYAIYYPPGTTFTYGGAVGCKDFGASDTVMTLPDGKTEVPYIVLPRCPASPGLDVWTTLSSFTSHEFVEEATDPTKTAFFTVDGDDMGWSLEPPVSEIADMCIADAHASYAADFGYVVQRAWSNAAAAAGKNPCIPVLDANPYFAAVPVFTDDVPITVVGSTFASTTKGIKLAVGESATIDVDLFSEAPVASWQVVAYDLAAAEGGSPELTVSLDRAQGNNGDVLHLTVTRLVAGASGGSRFLLYSVLGADSSFWLGYVSN